MVRSFDGDGDGALCARDVDDLMEHFRGDRFERSERFAADRAKTQAKETARFDALAAEGAIGVAGRGRRRREAVARPRRRAEACEGECGVRRRREARRCRLRGTRARRGGEL